MPRYVVQVLGRPVVTDTRSGATIEIPAGKTLALLCYLVLHGGAPQREELYHLLWGDSPRDRGLQSVRQALWLIRHTFGETALAGRDGTALDRGLLDSDVAALREAIADGRVADGERLWRGRFLDRFAVAGAPAWDRWVEETRAGLEREYGAALAAAAGADSARGDTDSALQRYTAAIQLEPFRLEYRLATIDLLLELRRGPDAEQALDAARSALPEPEFAAALAERGARLRDVLRDRALEPIAALSRPELVGRAQELSDLIGRWNLVRRGRTQRVVLHGRSGVGKTRLAEELAAVVEQDHGRAVVVRTTEPESGLPWATIVTLVRRLLVLPGASGISAGSDAVLRRLVPSLARQATTEYGAGGPQPAVLADALADLLGAVAYEAPLQVVLDDAQWIDQDSWALLSRLLTQIEADPVLFLLTVRDGETAPAVERALARVRQGMNALSVRLANLSRAETAELLAYVLGSEQAAGDGIGDRIFAVTRGNPLFIVETTKMLRDVGALRLSGERWVFDAARVPEHFPLPASIEQLLRKRVERLSPTAERIARILAQRGTPQDIADLQPAGVPRTVWADAIGELVDRGVVLRTEEGYALAHEQIAAVVRAGPLGAVRRRWAVGAAVVLGLGLLLGAVAAVALQPWEPLYGGGVIYVHDDSGFATLKPPSRLRRDWVLARIPSPIPGNTSWRFVRRTVSGEVIWGASVQLQRDPYGIEVREDGTTRTVFRDTTDAEVNDISPDGGRFVFGWDNPETWRQYDVIIATVGRDSAAPRRVRQNLGLASQWKWSPDGLLLAGFAVSARDTLYAITPDGRTIWFRETPNAEFEWCPDGSLLLESPEDLSLDRVFFGPDSLARVPVKNVIPTALLCAPDSRHAVITLVRDGMKVLSLVDLQTGAAAPLPAVAPGAQLVDWVPDTVLPVPRRVRLEPRALSLVAGERRGLRALLEFSDGSSREAPVRLVSSDTSLLSVTESGVLALHAGSAQVIARYRDVLEDTANVTVRPGDGSDPGLLDDFATYDTTVWLTIGSPTPVATSYRGQSALHLNGDGSYLDGIASRTSMVSREGVTAELEFSLPLNRKDRQRVQLALTTVEPRNNGTDQPAPGPATAEFIYPAEYLDHFDPGVAAFGAFGLNRHVDLRGSLPSNGWTQVAVQVKPNGYAELVINGRVVAASKLRHQDAQEARWWVCVWGASVDTRLLVRRLRFYRGIRYWSPSEPTD